LSVIDEAQPKQVDDTMPSASNVAAAPPPPPTAVAPATNGPPEARDPGASWTNFPFGEGEYPQSESQKTTPRHSVSGFMSSTEDVSRTDTQGRQTPESDRMTAPISS
jgi:hypothetical protein